MTARDRQRSPASSNRSSLPTVLPVSPQMRPPARPRAARAGLPLPGTGGWAAPRTHLPRSVGQGDEVPFGGPGHEDDLLGQLLLPHLPEGGHGGGAPRPGAGGAPSGWRAPSPSPGAPRPHNAAALPPSAPGFRRRCFPPRRGLGLEESGAAAAGAAPRRRGEAGQALPTLRARTRLPPAVCPSAGGKGSPPARDGSLLSPPQGLNRPRP